MEGSLGFSFGESCPAQQLIVTLQSVRPYIHICALSSLVSQRIIILSNARTHLLISCSLLLPGAVRQGGGHACGGHPRSPPGVGAFSRTRPRGE